MKTFTLVTLAALLAVALPSSLHSQLAREPRTPLEKLQAIRAENEQLIGKQVETLKKLEDLQQESQQLKIFGKRS